MFYDIPVIPTEDNNLGKRDQHDVIIMTWDLGFDIKHEKSRHYNSRNL